MTHEHADRAGGRPRRQGVPRDAAGRIVYDRRHARCACGAAIRARSRQCHACYDATRAADHRSRPCEWCGRGFTPTRHTAGRFCKVACVNEWQRERGLALRVAPDAAESRRKSRRRTRAIRRTRGWSDRQMWRVVGPLDGWICWLCHAPIDPTLPRTDERAATADHVTPIARGGLDVLDNLRAAHRRCNSRRRDLVTFGAGAFAPVEAAP